MSTDNAHPTRLACKKLLENIGVNVVVQNADGMAVLKCRASELRGRFSRLLSPLSILKLTSYSSTDATGSTGPLKSVKFRVELSSHTTLNSSPLLGNGHSSSDPRSQYPTCVTLVMEKGAHSTFKAAYNRLRAQWE
jgi:hypothetical protein